MTQSPVSLLSNAKSFEDQPRSLLLMSTSVGALGSGKGGGVELTLFNMVQALLPRGYTLTVVAPEGSELGNVPVVQIPGGLQVPAQTQSRLEPVTMPSHSVLANMWHYARQIQDRFDLIVNFAYDWLPFYLTPFFKTPIAHLVSMGSVSEAMDAVIESVAVQYPHAIGVHTRTQAETFAFAQDCVPVGNGVDLSRYDYCDQPDAVLGWLGRISPEKGLEDAIAAAQATRFPLKVMGHIQDPAYFEQLQQQFPQAFEYLGFLDTEALQQVVRRCRAVLATPRWVEAFGNVVIEALACGVPVVAYRRGGPGEIVQQGKTGWLVEPDSVAGLIDGIQAIDQIDRRACRQQVEQTYSLNAWGDRLEAWFNAVVQSRTGG